MKTAHSIGALFLSVAVLAGCMSAKPDAANYSGWMKNYDDLTEFKTATGGTSMRWISPSLKKGQYTALMIDPVTYYPAAQPSSQVSQKTLQEIPTYLVQQVSRSLGSDIQIVQKPGPGVLRLRAAITGVDTPTEGLQFYQKS